MGSPDSTERDLRFIAVANAELCVETFGDAGDPAILLMSGIGNPMDWWDEELCEQLAAGPRHIIRYDYRDTGQSTSSEPGAPTYTSRDMIDDVVGVLDGLGVATVHLVGISAGGGIAQEVAAHYPERVATLTLLDTSPAGPVDRELPPPAARLRAHFADPLPGPDWSDRTAAIGYLVDDARAYVGSHPFDEDRAREIAGRVVDRTINIEASVKNHAILPDGDLTPPQLGEITAPTLVLHGTDDPLFPFPHGEALAAAIPGARLLPLEGGGHEYPPRPLWDVFVPAVLEHTIV